MVTFIECRFGSLTKLQTCGELVIGLGVVVPVFDLYGTVPHRLAAACTGVQPRLQTSIAAIGVDKRRLILVKSLLQGIDLSPAGLGRPDTVIPGLGRRKTPDNDNRGLRCVPAGTEWSNMAAHLST
jgi:hypothetical protein